MTDAAATAPEPVRRKDYRQPNFWIDTVELVFELGVEQTLVRARLAFTRNSARADGGQRVVLDAEELDLRSVTIDGRELAADEFRHEGEELEFTAPADKFVLETVTLLRPQDNTQLSGLYRTGEGSGTFCSQCEALGFRRITPFLDRPDVMSRYTVTIIGDTERWPVMLSNGNRISTTELEDGRTQVVWEDPFKKPCYLFALVAGDLHCHPGAYTTSSGREVRLEIWVEPRNADACEHALASLQKSMRWDEEAFGLEYDLDLYMIVATDDFNMGAMENKGLNVFNSKFVLARPETATDADYMAIEGVIGHEYFHNWTGNRVTCRDWFQLTLKEGLTVYRDQEFSSDMQSRAVQRIDDVRSLRLRQFNEDAGPAAHPVRPESYISMDNFYTATVYEKGAEVVRMYEMLLGKQGFRKGMDLYFQRHDGDAVTCDDFRAAMADANGRNLDQFERWYETPGTPTVDVQGAFDASAKTYTLKLAQAQDGPPLHIPVAMGLLDESGADIPLVLAGEDPAAAMTTRVLELTDAEQSFCFSGIEAQPVPSLLRGFSAPVRLRAELAPRELAFLFGHDSDAFNRWEAGQELAKRVLLGLTEAVSAGRELTLDPTYSESFGRVLADTSLDGSSKALALTLPAEQVLAQDVEVIDPDAIHRAREFMVKALAGAHRAALEAVFDSLSGRAYQPTREQIDARRLKNLALGFLMSLETPEHIARATAQYETADNMTDSQAAFAALVFSEVAADARDAAIAGFYERWKHDPLVLDKWFMVQASSPRSGSVARVRALTRHPDFTLKNPNRVRSVIGVFAAGNPVCFHAADGGGYDFVAEHVIALDSLNPQIAARLAGSFDAWRRYDTSRQRLMRAALERIQGSEGLSKDTGEIVTRALG